MAGDVRLHFVWTRNIDADRAFGRLKVARSIRSALQDAFPTTVSTIQSIATTRSRGSMVRAVGQYALSLLRLRPLPLQCLLFADPFEAERVIAEIPIDTTAVYVDGIRCFTFLRRLRRRRPGLAIVTDLDDLMSRRMSLLLELGEAPSTGYMRGSIPGFIEAILRSRLLTRLLLRYEAATLRAVEREIVRLSERTVLLSSKDAEMLTGIGGNAAKVVGIPPTAELIRAATPLLPGPIRFVFVGSDTLRQNQLTIDKLLALWRMQSIAAALTIYGEQTRILDLPPNVTMPGYARTIDEVYDGRSVLLSPSYLAGGIKTKVLEAFGYGTAVVGNAVTFEAIDLPKDYPLLLRSDAALASVLADPEAFRDQFGIAATIGATLVRAQHDPAKFAIRWTELIHSAVAAWSQPPRTARASAMQSARSAIRSLRGIASVARRNAR